jgi:tetratricopeptide (TPR) repeat protein
MNARALLAIGLLLIGSCGDDGGGDAPPQHQPAPMPSAARLGELDPQLAQAIRAGAAAIEAAPGESRPWLDLGMTYEAHSMHTLAQSCYEGATVLAQEDARAWYRLGLSRVRAGELREGARALERTLELEPNYNPARLRLGFALLDGGEPERARLAFEGLPADDLVARQGLAQVALESGKPDRTLELLADPALMSGPHRSLTQRLRGRALARTGHAAQAQSALAAGRSAKPSIVDPWSREVARFKVGVSALVLRAGKLVDRGRVPAALELLEPLRAGGDGRVLRLLGSAYAHVGRFADAAECLREAREGEPDDGVLTLALAAALSQDMRLSEAMGVLERFLAEHPTEVELWGALQHLAAGAGAHDRVIEARDSARDAGNTDAELELGAGLAELALARPGLAETSFTRALELGGDEPEALVGRARARLALERFADAAADLARVELLAPEHASLPGLRALLENEND